MEEIVNPQDVVGYIVDHLTQNVTGDLFLSLLSIIIVLMVVCLAFQIPLEWSSLAVLPVLIGAVAYYSSFLPVLAVFLVYVSVIIAKNWLFNR